MTIFPETQKNVVFCEALGPPYNNENLQDSSVSAWKCRILTLTLAPSPGPLVFLMFPLLFLFQYHSEGCESSAASDQLQSPQHALSQRQAAGQSPIYLNVFSTYSSCASFNVLSLFTQEVEARSDLSYPNFSQLYRTLMFDAQKSVSVNHTHSCEKKYSNPLLK